MLLFIMKVHFPDGFGLWLDQNRTKTWPAGWQGDADREVVAAALKVDPALVEFKGLLPEADRSEAEALAAKLLVEEVPGRLLGRAFRITMAPPEASWTPPQGSLSKRLRAAYDHLARRTKDPMPWKVLAADSKASVAEAKGRQTGWRKWEDCALALLKEDRSARNRGLAKKARIKWVKDKQAEEARAGLQKRA